MKKILLIVLCFIYGYANAQYYQHIFGNTGIENNSDGLTPQVGSAGYFLTGVSNNSGAGHLLAVRCDQSGSTAGTGYYTKDFTINNNSFPLVDLEVNQAKCAERVTSDPNTNGLMAIVGGWLNQNSGAQGLFYCELTSNGTINFGPVNISSSTYKLNLGSVSKGTLANGDFDALYITGWAVSGTTRNIFVIKYDMQTYSVVWDNIYDIYGPIGRCEEEGYDIIEDPGNPNNVVVVGRTTETNDDNGIILTIDGNSGSPVQADIWGNTGSADYFSSISPAHDPDGFIIGGVTNINGSNDMWAVKVDNVFSTVWNSYRDYNNGLGNGDERNTNIIERLNTNSQYEYYQLGDVYPGVLGSGDLVVYKLDINGQGVGGGQFTYGDYMLDYTGAIDLANPTSDGISVMGSRTDISLGANQVDFYQVRAYYNGAVPSGCTYDLRDVSTEQDGPYLMATYGIFWNSIVSVTNLAYTNNSGLNSTELCFDYSAIGGSNDRVILEEKGDKQGVMVSPNPMGQGIGNADLSIESEVAEAATVSIYDMMGRRCYVNGIMLQKGENRFTLDLSGTNMSQGMYSVTISGTNTAKKLIFLVK